MNLQQTQLAGYRIQERIGIGGMGEVFKAWHPGLNRVAAIKILYQKEMSERFRNEAYIQSSVNHPNIAKLYEYLQYGDKPCIIMEYVEGYSLDSYIIRKGRLDNDETERILGQVASALNYLHRQDILHRDIKPQNFKIEKDGTVKMLDFGISKNKYTPKLTQMGFVVGTTEYMAPEQFNHQVEKKSDIWSLGVMTYEMLTGHLPFNANNPVSLRAQITRASFTDPKIFVPNISPKLTTLIERSLKPNPAQRMSAADVEKLLLGEKPKATTQEPWLPKVKRPEKHWIYLGAVVVVMVAFFIFLGSGRQEADIPGGDSVRPDSVKTTVAGGSIKMMIDVPGINNARLLLPDGTEHPIPFEISGNDGQRIDFILKADGYQDKLVKDFEFNNRRSSYAYNLDKKN